MNVPNRKTPPAIRPIEKLTVANLRTITLDNGMTLKILDRGQDEVNRLVALRAGGMAEAPVPALATLTSDLLREGTTHHSGASLAETLEYNGSWIEATTHAHHTSLSMSSINNRFDHVAGMMAEIWSEPSFDAQPLEIKKEAEIRKLEQLHRKVSYKARMRSTILTTGPDHPMSHFPAPEEIRAIRIEDIREYYARSQRLWSTTLYISGRITPAIIERVNKTFGALKVEGSGRGEMNIVPFTPINPPYYDKVEVNDAIQSAISITLPAVPRSHPDYIYLRIAVKALGGYFGSRLVANIREDKGYTYGISAGLSGYLDGSFIGIDSECDNRYTDLVIEEIKKELTGMSARPADAEGMMRLKQNLMTSLLGVIESPFSSMSYYITRELAGTPDDYFERQLEAINSLTPEKILEISAKYLLPEKMITVVAGK